MSYVEVGPVPQARPRSNLGYRASQPDWHMDKERLVDLFRNFRSSAVDTEHLQLARELIDRHRGVKWYEYVQLDRILEQNEVSVQGLSFDVHSNDVHSNVVLYLVLFCLRERKTQCGLIAQLHFVWHLDFTKPLLFAADI